MENEILWDRIAKLTAERDRVLATLRDVHLMCSLARSTDDIVAMVEATIEERHAV